MKHSLCRNCGKNLLKAGHYFKGTCSEDCYHNHLKKDQWCEPKCAEDSLSAREVIFNDGTNHLQQFCEKCTRTRFLPKSWGIAIGSLPPRITASLPEGTFDGDCELDFLTDAARGS